MNYIVESIKAFFVTIYRKDIEGLIKNTEKNLKNDTINIKIKLNKTEKKILKIIQNRPDITQIEIAENLKVTIVTVSRNINKLKDKDIIKRNGANKNGYWQIIK